MQRWPQHSQWFANQQPTLAKASHNSAIRSPKTAGPFIAPRLLSHVRTRLMRRQAISKDDQEYAVHHQRELAP